MPWADVVVFHMDEYVGIGPEHPASFQRWIRQRIVEPAGPRAAHYLDGLGPTRGRSAAATPSCSAEHPLDLCCLGIGENGHLAFNDPPVADFDDPARREGGGARRRPAGASRSTRATSPPTPRCPDLAVTVTIPALLRAGAVLAVVPEARKAEPVRAALEGPVTTACPASILQRTPHATVFLDRRLGPAAVPGR